MTSAFIPTFTEIRARGDRRETWRFAGVFFWDLALVMGALTVLGVVFAPGLVKVIAYGFRTTEGKWAQTIAMTRTMFPYLFFISLSALASAILNSCRRFFVPASTPVLFNVAVIAAAALAARGARDPARVFCWGVLAGGVLQLLFQLPFLWKEGMRFRPGLDFRDPGVRRIAGLMVPGVLGAGVYQVNFALSRMIASGLERGSTSALYYSSRIEELTLGLFSIALSVALLPVFSEHAAARDMAEMKRTLGFSLKLTSFVTFPAAAGLVVLSRPIIRVLFERGMFDRGSTALSSACLLFFALGLPFLSGVKMIAPAFFSLKDTRTPVLVGVGVMAVNIGLSFALKGPLRVGGIALALSLSQIVNFAALLILLERRIGAVGRRELAGPAAKGLAASGLMAGALLLVRPLIDAPAAPFVRQAAGLLGGIAVGVVLYGVFLRLLSPRDARELAAAVFHAARPDGRKEAR